MRCLFCKPRINNISVPELRKSYLTDKTDKFFLDVRTRSEFDTQSIPLFTNVPLSTLRDHLHDIPRDKEIVVICQSGARSLLACKILRQAGYEKITNVRGGINRWY